MIIAFFEALVENTIGLLHLARIQTSKATGGDEDWKWRLAGQ
jgi:hypothetical protein